MNDDLLFAEDTDEPPIEELGFWKVLVVDDEPEVHAVTKLALSDFILNGKRLKFISAYSGSEAKKRFIEHDDIAVVLLDVVMETDEAGLEVAQYVRDDLDNHFTRIILRTGQPGQAPEKHVIINYDINDYKSKTELTAQKLFTVIIAALRSYRDIVAIEENRAGLEKIIDASTDLFATHSLEKFMQGLIQQVSSILGCAKDAAYITTAVAAPKSFSQHASDELYVFAGNGEYSEKEGKRLKDAVDENVYALCKEALRSKQIVYGDDYVVAYCDSKNQNGSILYLTGLARRVGETDKRLIKLFSDNVQIAFENLLLTNEIEGTQREVIERLSKALDHESQGNRHIERMVKMAEILARGLKLEDRKVRILKLAIPLHDVGNALISPTLLQKTDPLTENEIFQIRQHAEFGYQILKDSDKPTIQIAAMLAKQHHERWDGAGYPEGLREKEIAVESRIAALVDVFDALVNKRPYKQKWPLEKVIETLKKESGKHFDPRLVTYLLENIDLFMQVQHDYADLEQQ
ncbi:DUF3369 domain-containing protein [Alteromonas ponticola]|uniref:DUF3369 domain-containing protein n=1 Tax=Alteromonas ponticola TaxID=2720613 RepID=A0ABX1QX33_9ALTE|nr:DUF3369 domain-containing protein [Alteromonas ponticola]NMH58803.1 DUF3369 domain-containing protein [Alteromonas ponticola]